MHPTPPRLNLVVIRSPNIDHAVVFYKALGLLFTKHAHGSGPEHYSSEIAGMVFEIYPLLEEQSPTTAMRLGFQLDHIDSVLPLLTEIGGTMISPPRDSPWGRRAVLRDLDGHSIELIERSSASCS